MRIIGHIEHPQLKITVFKMENRISVKFENAFYEQTYKLGLDERLEDFNSVQKLIDGTFMEQIQQAFQYMHQTRLAAYARAFPIAAGHQFEEII